MRRAPRPPTSLVALSLGVLLHGFIAAPARAIPEDIPGDAGLLDDPGGWNEALVPFETSRYRAAATYSRKHAGLALLVVEGDTLVFEGAENGYDLRRAHHLWSGTKTFTCALAAAAQADGLFTLDTTLSATLGLADRRASLTVRDLLSLTSGLSEATEILTGDMLAARPIVADKEAWALREITAVYAPGERFRYAASAFVLFSALAGKALGEDPLAYLERRVLDPIGFRHTAWLRDPAGHAYFSFGAYTTARSWARFGLLLRDDGVFRGQRVLPAGALAPCFTGTTAMPAYGLGVWLNHEARQLWLPPALQGRFASKGPILLPGGPDDLIAAAGYNDNRLYVIPSRSLIIVRFGRGHPAFEDDRLLALLLER